MERVIFYQSPQANQSLFRRHPDGYLLTALRWSDRFLFCHAVSICSFPVSSKDSHPSSTTTGMKPVGTPSSPWRDQLMPLRLAAPFPNFRIGLPNSFHLNVLFKLSFSPVLVYLCVLPLFPLPPSLPPALKSLEVCGRPLFSPRPPPYESAFSLRNIFMAIPASAAPLSYISSPEDLLLCDRPEVILMLWRESHSPLVSPFRAVGNSF